jgi:ABC-type hemin transport system ATPase subunit
LRKSFSGAPALVDGSLELRRGEIHALCGGNGAGKSTLLKILMGVLQPDAGEIVINGAAVRFANPGQALAAGLAMVEQELSAIPDLTVAENILLGAEPRRFGFVDFAAMNRKAAALLRVVGCDADPGEPMRRLSVASQQLVEIAKALYGGDEEEARKKPVFSMLLCPNSPLELSSNACQVIVKGARLGIPVNVLSMAMSGGSAPVFLAGTLVTHNAEVLAGITLSQLASPGAKVWYGSSTTAFDLKRGTAPVGSPELGLISAAVAKMGQYYGLPTYVAGI